SSLGVASETSRSNAKMVGRSLRRRLPRHHIDRNSKNNEPDNLVLIDGDDHMIMHALPIRREHFRKKRKEDKRTIEAEIRAQSQHRAAEERWFALKYGYGNE